jgi:hypothetical protein
MVSSSQIRNRLAMFLDGLIDLDAFEDWFVQSTWDIHLSGSKAAETLTFAVEESLSEYSSGHLNEQQLRNELYDIVHRDTHNIVMNFDALMPQVLVSEFGSASPATVVVLSAAEFGLVPAHQTPPQTNTIQALQPQA